MKDLILRYFDAFANLYGIIPIKRAYRIIEKQNPELNLTKEQFAEIVNELDFPDTFSPEKAGEAILDICKDIEHSLGRNSGPMYRKDGSRIYSSRTIDIDILFLGNERIETERLSVPHRLMRCRDFVMTPLREIASKSIISTFKDIFN